MPAHGQDDLQELADSISSAACAFGLTISLQKTVVLAQAAPRQQVPVPKVKINGTELQAVDSFPYLGSCLTSDCGMDREISNRLAKAGASFGRLSNRVWNERGLTVQTKIAVYKAVVLTSLLYGCETWTMYSRQLRTLDQFHLRCLRKIMRISWEDRTPNTEVLRRAQLWGIEALIMKAQLRWVGHIMRMSDTRLPKIIFLSELADGARAPGGPIKRYKDGIRATLKACRIAASGWESLAADRGAWRSAVAQGVAAYEEQRLQRLERKREARKERKLDPTIAVACPVCGRLCASQFGLQSHMRCH